MTPEFRSPASLPNEHSDLATPKFDFVSFEFSCVFTWAPHGFEMSYLFWLTIDWERTPRICSPDEIRFVFVESRYYICWTLALLFARIRVDSRLVGMFAWFSLHSIKCSQIYRKLRYRRLFSEAKKIEAGWEDWSRECLVRGCHSWVQYYSWNVSFLLFSLRFWKSFFGSANVEMPSVILGWSNLVLIPSDVLWFLSARFLPDS